MAKKQPLLEYIKNEFGDEYIPLEKYKGGKTKIKFKHKCGLISEMAPSYMLNGRHKCECLHGSKRHTHEFFSNFLTNKFGEGEFIVHDIYQGSRYPLSMTHSGCGRTYKIEPSSMMYQKTECPYCGPRPRTFTLKEFKEEVYKIFGDEYEVLSNEYINTTTKVKMLHVECDNEYETTPQSILKSHSRCPYCFGNMKKTTNEFKKEIFEMFGDQYTILGEYVNSKVNILIRHEECGLEFNMIPNRMLNGAECPHCYNYESKGERKVSEILDEMGIIYEREKTFPGMKYVYHLRMDFYIEDHNLAIEYDGEQHFRDDIFYSSELIKVRDKIKDDYCEDNNIRLLRIPYYNFDNIEEILKEELIVQRLSPEGSRTKR